MIYLLTRNEDDIRYDENTGFVVRAGSADEARRIAADAADDEGPQTWLNADLSTCELVDAFGKPRVILDSYNAG